MTESTSGAAPLPASAKTASHNAIRSAVAETEAALSKVSLSSEANNKGETSTDAENESLEEGEIKEDAEGEAKAEQQDADDADPNRQITVFSDHQRFNVVHPLYNGWSVSQLLYAVGAQSNV